jgi:hypothetical protein
MMCACRSRAMRSRSFRTVVRAAPAGPGRTRRRPPPGQRSARHVRVGGPERGRAGGRDGGQDADGLVGGDQGHGQRRAGAGQPVPHRRHGGQVVDGHIPRSSSTTPYTRRPGWRCSPSSTRPAVLTSRTSNAPLPSPTGTSGTTSTCWPNRATCKSPRGTRGGGRVPGPPSLRRVDKPSPPRWLSWRRCYVASTTTDPARPADPTLLRRNR